MALGLSMAVAGPAGWQQRRNRPGGNAPLDGARPAPGAPNAPVCSEG